jgi:PAS domain S-box-containing protein
MPLEKVIGSSMDCFVLPEDLASYETLMRQAQEGRSKGEIRLRTKYGSVVPVHVSISPLELEAGIACAIITDLTEHKRNQELLAAQTLERTIRAEAEAGRQRIANILESITDSFLAFDREWRIADVNQRGAAILGKARSELIGKIFWDVFPQARTSEFYPQCLKAMTERVPAHCEGLSRIAVGSWLEMHVYPVEEGLAIYFRDITDRKRAEEELRKTQAELAHVTRVTMMVELAASIAHEINQPLGAIVNNSNVCLRLLSAAPSSQAEARAEAREALVDIVNDANRASTIIERIRAMAKGTSPERVSLQPEDLIADTLVLAQGELAAHRIEVRTDLQEDLPAVTGDRIQFQQVLLNLILNAIEAMSGVTDERRVLAIGAKCGEVDGKLAIALNVRDLGRGFKPEESERLFDAFYTTKPHGLGMGLRISRSVVEAHGGRLWATLNNGHGATFFCVLPAMGTIRKATNDQ